MEAALFPHASLSAYEQRLSAAAGLDEVLAVVRAAARELAGSDGATVVLREGHVCFYADEDAIAPLWKGQRFPMTECISGWAMLHRTPAVVPDITVDDRIPQEAYRPTFVESLAMVPIGRRDPLGAIGVYWARQHRAAPAVIAALDLLADATAEALVRVGLADVPWAPNFRTPSLAVPPQQGGDLAAGLAG